MTVALVGILSAVFVGMSNVPDPAPVAGFSIEKSGNDILVHHQNGAVLPEGKYAVLIDGKEAPLPAGDFTPGLTLKLIPASSPVGSVAVVYKDGASSTMLAQKIFESAGSGSALPSGESSESGSFDWGEYAPVQPSTWQYFKDKYNNGERGLAFREGLYVEGSNYWMNICQTTPVWVYAEADYDLLSEFVDSIPRESNNGFYPFPPDRFLTRKDYTNIVSSSNSPVGSYYKAENGDIYILIEHRSNLDIPERSVGGWKLVLTHK